MSLVRQLAFAATLIPLDHHRTSEKKLLEQRAQLEALAAIAHNRRRNVARAIDLPAENGGAARSRIANCQSYVLRYSSGSLTGSETSARVDGL